MSVPNPYHDKLERALLGSAFQNVHCPPSFLVSLYIYIYIYRYIYIYIYTRTRITGVTGALESETSLLGFEAFYLKHPRLTPARYSYSYSHSQYRDDAPRLPLLFLLLRLTLIILFLLRRQLQRLHITPRLPDFRHELSMQDLQLFEEKQTSGLRARRSHHAEHTQRPRKLDL